MKYLIHIIIVIIGLCIILLANQTRDLSRELTDLNAMDTLHSEEIKALRGHLGIVEDKTDRIIGKVKDAVKPFIKIIPIDGGFLGVRDLEKKDANKN